MEHCRGVPLHDEYSSYSVFFEYKNFWQKKRQNRRSIFLRTSVYDFYLLVTEREEFEVVKTYRSTHLGVAKLDIFTDVSNFERIAGLCYKVTRETTRNEKASNIPQMW